MFYHLFGSDRPWAHLLFSVAVGSGLAVAWEIGVVWAMLLEQINGLEDLIAFATSWLYPVIASSIILTHGVRWAWSANGVPAGLQRVALQGGVLAGYLARLIAA